MSELTTRFVTAGDQNDWRPLFEGYAEFYKTEMNDHIAAAVWGWLLDPEHVLEGLLVRDARQHAVGMLHFRAARGHSAVATRALPTTCLWFRRHAAVALRMRCLCGSAALAETGSLVGSV